MCAVIWWGTFFPLISEALTGRRHSFGPPMFDRLTVPLALVLVLLSGIGPLIAWRRATAANLRRNFVVTDRRRRRRRRWSRSRSAPARSRTR